MFWLVVVVGESKRRHPGGVFAVSQRSQGGSAVDLADLGTLIRERREALGLSQSRLARFSFIRVREAARHCAGRWWGMEEE
jgi:hypothetical protein